MNVRIEYDMTWSSAIWFEGRLQINDYTAELAIYTNTADQDDHVTSLARLNHFVYHELANTVFCHKVFSKLKDSVCYASSSSSIEPILILPLKS